MRPHVLIGLEPQKSIGSLEPGNKVTTDHIPLIETIVPQVALPDVTVILGLLEFLQCIKYV